MTKEALRNMDRILAKESGNGAGAKKETRPLGGGLKELHCLSRKSDWQGALDRGPKSMIIENGLRIDGAGMGN